MRQNAVREESAATVVLLPWSV